MQKVIKEFIGCREEKDQDKKEDTIINNSYYLQENAEIYPDQKAIIYLDHKENNYNYITFKQLNEMSNLFSHGLRKAGIEQGIKTIILVKPSPECIALIFALYKLGAIPVVVDPGMGIKKMLHCFDSTKPDAFIGIPVAHILRILKRKYFKSLKIWITVGKKYFWSGPTIRDFQKSSIKMFEPVKTNSDELAAIFFTTGSTGPPKGVEYTYGMINAILKLAKSSFNFKPGETDLATFLLFGFVAVLTGSTMVIPDMDPTKPAYVNPKKIIENIVDHGVTSMFASPALLDRVGRYGKLMKIKLPSLKRVYSGGAPVSVKTIKNFTKMLNDDIELCVTYGATEALPISYIGSKEILLETAKLSNLGFGTCVGRPFEGISVKIIKITDLPIEAWSENVVVKRGVIGEIVVKGERVNKRYYKLLDANKQSKIKDGNEIWHRMGDLGWIDEKGRIWFCGRKKHKVETESGPLFSVCCESIFNTHPKVFRSALIGIGPESIQKPVMCIELEKDLININKDELRKELLDLGKKFNITMNIGTILFHKSFPVDIRHNAKIFREKLIKWAEKKLK